MDQIWANGENSGFGPIGSTEYYMLSILTSFGENQYLLTQSTGWTCPCLLKRCPKCQIGSQPDRQLKEEQINDILFCLSGAPNEGVTFM